MRKVYWPQKICRKLLTNPRRRQIRRRCCRVRRSSCRSRPSASCHSVIRRSSSRTCRLRSTPATASASSARAVRASRRWCARWSASGCDLCGEIELRLNLLPASPPLVGRATPPSSTTIARKNSSQGIACLGTPLGRHTRLGCWRMRHRGRPAKGTASIRCHGWRGCCRWCAAPTSWWWRCCFTANASCAGAIRSRCPTVNCGNSASAARLNTGLWTSCARPGRSRARRPNQALSSGDFGLVPLRGGCPPVGLGSAS